MAWTEELDDVAAWFENCGMGDIGCETVAKIIRKWVPSATLAIPLGCPLCGAFKGELCADGCANKPWRGG